MQCSGAPREGRLSCQLGTTGEPEGSSEEKEGMGALPRKFVINTIHTPETPFK